MVQARCLCNDCYRIRPLLLKQKENQVGARVITHLHIEGSLVYPIAIYDKSEKENISDKQITKLLELIKN